MAMSAHVARVRVKTLEYLAPNSDWVSNPSLAAVFESSREATRQALRLPSGHKAFALPFGAV
jgi:hypothetical protein